MVFPTEAALLEAFTITYDELGYDDERRQVNPFFVEWVLRDPAHFRDDAERRTAEAIRAASASWTADHRCWVPGVMPLHTEAAWPLEAAAAVLGASPAPDDDAEDE